MDGGVPSEVPVRVTIVRRGPRVLRVLVSEEPMPQLQRGRLERAGFAIDTAQPLRVPGPVQFAAVVSGLLDAELASIREALGRAADALGGAPDVVGPMAEALAAEAARCRADARELPKDGAGDLLVRAERIEAALQGLRGAA